MPVNDRSIGTARDVQIGSGLGLNRLAAKPGGLPHEAVRQISSHNFHRWAGGAPGGLSSGPSGARLSAAHGHLTSGGIEERIDSTLPPVLSPKIVPRS